MLMTLALAAAAATATPAPKEATIDFISRFIEYRKEGDTALLIHSFRGDWFRVTFQGGSCPRLTEANGLTFDAGPIDTFDRASRVIAGGFICPIASIVKIDPPVRRLR